MAVFPVLEIEKEVQIGDKTRLDGSKSFVSQMADPIYNVSITPGSTGSPIVLSPDSTPAATESENWYTDWIWTSYAFDIDGTSDKIDFEEAGIDYVASVANSTYTTTSSIASAIETALNAAGATGTFTVTVDAEDRLTISSTVAFSLLISTGDNRFNGLSQHVGFGELDTDFVTTITGLPIEYGRRKITLSVDDDTNPAETYILYQHVYTELGDRLFCSDNDLRNHEEDILKWVPPGRSSHKDVIRRVQRLLLEQLAGEGYVNSERNKFTKWDIKDLKEVRDWSTYWSLQLIFEGNSNAVDDVFDLKSRKYASLATLARNRYIALDIDGDGKVDFDENLRHHTINLFRR